MGARTILENELPWGPHYEEVPSEKKISVDVNIKVNPPTSDKPSSDEKEKE